MVLALFTEKAKREEAETKETEIEYIKYRILELQCCNYHIKARYNFLLCKEKIMLVLRMIW